jgi:hypothetical protein
MNCQTYRELFYPTCPESIALPVVMHSSTPFKWYMTNKFGQVFTSISTSDGSGNLTIQIEDPLSLDMFNEFSGDYQLKLTTNSGDPILLEDQYDYYVLIFQKTFTP